MQGGFRHELYIPTFNSHQRASCGQRRCTGLGTLSITPPPSPTRTRNHLTSYGMIVPLPGPLTHFFVQDIVVAAPRRSTYPEPRSVFASGQQSTTRDLSRMLALANEVVEIRDTTWEAPATKGIFTVVNPLDRTTGGGRGGVDGRGIYLFFSPSPSRLIGRGTFNQHRKITPEAQATVQDVGDANSIQCDE